MAKARRSSKELSGPPTATVRNWPGLNREGDSGGDHGQRVVRVDPAHGQDRPAYLHRRHALLTIL